MSDLNDFLKIFAEGKRTDPVAVKAKEQQHHIKESVKEDLGSLFSQLSSLKSKQKVVQEVSVEPIIEEKVVQEEVLKEVVLPTPEQKIKDNLKNVDKYLKNKSFQQPEPDPVPKELAAVTQKLKFLEQAIGRIAATGPGSGEVNLRYLDDVDRPTIYDMRYLRYNDSKKKFEFAEVNPHDIVYTTTLVTTPTYTATDSDYYIGVNYDGPTTITLPTTPSSGRMLIIKDESGLAETNPITVQGTVDNDAGGFIIQINNGATQLIYRNGWRIV